MGYDVKLAMATMSAISCPAGSKVGCGRTGLDEHQHAKNLSEKAQSHPRGKGPCQPT